MTHQGSNVYEGTIPSQSNGTTIWYYIEATDNATQITTDPSGAPSNYYSYGVGPAQIIAGPTITARGPGSFLVEWNTSTPASSIIE